MWRNYKPPKSINAPGDVGAPASLLAVGRVNSDNTPEKLSGCQHQPPQIQHCSPLKLHGGSEHDSVVSFGQFKVSDVRGFERLPGSRFPHLSLQPLRTGFDDEFIPGLLI